MAFCPNNNRPNNNLAIIQIMAFPRVSSSIMIKSHFSDRPIFQTRRSSRPHATVLGFPPQSRIPKLLSDKSKRQKRRKRNKCLQNIRQSAYSLLLAPNRPLQKSKKRYLILMPHTPWLSQLVSPSTLFLSYQCTLPCGSNVSLGVYRLPLR